MAQEQISVRVLDEEYKIKCDSKQVDLLKKSASYLDEKMAEIKSSSNTMQREKVAVMAALNVVSEYLSQEAKLGELDDVSGEIEKIQNIIDTQESI